MKNCDQEGCINYPSNPSYMAIGICGSCADSAANATKPLDKQVGGGHYKDMKIQPIEYAVANGFNPCQTLTLRYISRKKGDKAKLIEDRRKAIHCIELEIGFLEDAKE